MSKVTVEHLGIECSGRTVGEAKRCAAAEAEKVLKFSPRIFSWRGYSVVITAVPFGARYSLIHPDDNGEKVGCSMTDRETVILSALRHLAQCARREGEYDLYEMPDCFRQYFRGRDGDNLVSDWQREDGFQRAYRQAKADGKNDHECHAWACEHTREFITTA